MLGRLNPWMLKRFPRPLTLFFYSAGLVAAWMGLVVGLVVGVFLFVAWMRNPGWSAVCLPCLVMVVFGAGIAQVLARHVPYP